MNKPVFQICSLANSTLAWFKSNVIVSHGRVISMLLYGIASVQWVSRASSLGVNRWVIKMATLHVSGSEVKNGPASRRDVH